MRPLSVTTLLLLLATAPVRAGSSNSLLDVSPDGKLLIVANTDNGTVTVVDAAARKKLREIPVGDHPEGVSWVGNGPLAVVTVNRDDRLAFVDANEGRVLTKLPVPNEPYGVVVTRDGRRAFVSHDYPGSVSEIDIEGRKVLRTFKVGNFVRGLALSTDETRLYATEFYTAKLLAADVASGRVTDSWDAHENDNLSRNVVLHPKRPKAYLAHLASRTHIFHARGSIIPQLSICDTVPPAPDKKRRTSFRMDTFNSLYVTCNPWEAALSPDGKRLYVIYSGTDDMNVCDVIDDDYREMEGIGRPVAVGSNPRAVRVSPDGKEVYVYNAMDFAISVHDRNGRRLASVSVCDPPHTPEWVRGKVLFDTAKPPMGGPRWVACSSCHPDGVSDGRVWKNPEGPRKTPALFGLAHTHPLHWSADRDEVQDFEYTLRGVLMQGRGLASGPIKSRNGFLPASELDEKLAGRSKDLDALAIYTNSFTFRLSPHIPAPGKLSPEAERGKAIFFSKETGCATCHSGPYYTNSSLKKPFNVHDVGTGDDPVEKMGPKFDTPTLLGVYRTAPYLHNGKAKTLMDVLTAANPNDKHGKTSHLKPQEREDLVAFLKSLPYELPPDETPNTVPHRLKTAKK